LGKKRPLHRLLIEECDHDGRFLIFAIRDERNNNGKPAMSESARPLSPHLQIYKWQLTMTLSILHRSTGIALAVGTLLVVALLLALAAGPDSYAMVQAFCASPFGLFLLFGWSWSLCFHLCNGIRHLAWDAGWGFEIPRVYLTGWSVVVLSLAFTILIWACVLTRGGVA
jgi:succinate dehydrogenase / fumarate reductase cytochrome b subunit